MRSDTSERVSVRNHYSYPPSDAHFARTLCGDDVRAERAPRACGVHGGPHGMLGVHVAHFRRICLTARNSLRRPTSPITSRTGPTRFDVWSSRGRWHERTLGERPHVHCSAAASSAGRGPPAPPAPER